MGSHNYALDGGRRFFCFYNNQRYYLACHRLYEYDKYDNESTKLNLHNNGKLRGENFSYENFENGKFCLYYKDNDDYEMKNWMLYIHKHQNAEYFTPLFHKNNCSQFILENADNNYVYIKEVKYNVYLYLNDSKKRDSNSYGISFYAGASTEKDKATKFRIEDI